MNKRKIVIIALVITLAATAFIGGTIAYFTDSDVKENEFTIGSIDVVISEENWDAAEEEELNKDMYPGQIIDKDPVVTNQGSNPAYVRISVTGLDQFAEKYDGVMIAYFTGGEKDALGENWVLGDDGYFYYTEALAENGQTSALFEQIQLPWELTNEDSAEPVVVTVQAVQSQGFTGEANAADLAAWFTACGF